jgi:glycine/D-amino acid oxidase-like deaminating enzyme
VKVIVVGGGIMGLCAAWALHRRSHRVTVYEQGAVPNPLASSSDQQRLIRYTYGAMAGYAAMVRQAYDAWDLLWTDLDQRLYAETGTLCIVRGDGAWVRESAEGLAAMHVPAEKLTVEGVRAMVPFVATEDVAWALHTPTGGILFAERIVAALGRHLRHNGQAVADHCPVAAVDPAKAEIVLADGRRDEADALVAAGPWSGRLVPALRGRVTPSRQRVVYLEPPARHADAWRRAPAILDQIEATRGGFFAVPPVGGTGLKMGDHGFTLQGDPDHDREPTDADVTSLTALCRGRIEHFDQYRPICAKTCFYSVTADERFIVEPVDRAWVLAGFSGHGFKFGAILGLVLADTLEGQRTPDSLMNWAAGR